MSAAESETVTLMPEPLPLPIRVLIKGPSTVNWTSWMSGPRTDFTFPRAMEAELLAAGRPAVVQAVTMPSERTSETLRDWQPEFLGWSPDVVVLWYGHQETIHMFLPKWLERHANSLRYRPRPWSTLYRTRLLKPLWMILVRIQQILDGRLPHTWQTWRPKNVAADLQMLIAYLQKLQNPLVFVVELPTPGSRGQKWFPGMAARVVEMNKALRQLVAGFDSPNVRIFSIPALIDQYADGDSDVATPDGFHYTPHMHAMIGKHLAEETMTWADTQPHLQIKTPGEDLA